MSTTEDLGPPDAPSIDWDAYAKMLADAPILAAENAALRTAARHLVVAIDALGFPTPIPGAHAAMRREATKVRALLDGPPKSEPEDAPYGGVPSYFP